MLVEAPEYDSNDGSSSANITDTEDELPEKKKKTANNQKRCEAYARAS